MEQEKIGIEKRMVKEQIVFTILGTLSCISDGMQYGWTAPVTPKLLSPNSPIKISKYQAEWLESILMVGACCGLPITMFLVDKIGRKRSLVCSSTATLVAWVIMAASTNVQYLFVARFFAGMAGDTAFVAAPMYIAEVADQKIRGFLSSIIYLMMLFGVLIIYCVAPFVPLYVPCVIGICLNTVTLISLPFLPDSPYYLLYKNKPEEAKKSLMKLRPLGNVDNELKHIAEVIETQKQEKGRPHDLFLVSSNRKALLIMVWLNSSQHMSSISVMLMNMHSILEEAGAAQISPSTTAIIFSAIMLCAAMSASLAIDNFGRKKLLITSGAFSGISLGVIALYFTLKSYGYDVLAYNWIPSAAVFSYAAGFKFGIGLVPIVLTAELFPAKLKALGMTISDACYVGFSLISLQLYHFLKNHYSIEIPFYIFSCWCFATVLVAIFYIPETNGKTLGEIQALLKGKCEEKDRLLKQNNNYNTIDGRGWTT